MTAQTILPANSVTGGYDVANSLRFNSGSSDTLSINMGTSSSRRIWTLSTWIKLSRDTNADNMNIVGTGASDDQNHIGFDGSGSVGNTKIALRHHNGTSSDIHIQSNANYNDQSAWYHVVYSVDTTQGTDTNRVKIYVNGTQVTSLATSTYPSQNYDWDFFQNGSTTYIGRRGHSSAYLLDGYLAETVWIDGTQLTPTSFGEFDEDSGIWKPISVSGLTFGDAGFYLETKQSGTSQNSSGLGADTSGNDNHFAVANLTALDQSTDTCTNNFATLNPLNSTLTNTVLSEGNLKLVGGRQSAQYTYITGTIAVSSGKWYWEVKAVDNSEIDQVGVAKMDLAQFATISTSTGLQGAAYGGRGVQMSNGNKVGDGSQGAHMGGFSANNICMIALDLDNNKITFGRNGSWSNGSGGADQTFANATAAYTDLTAGAMYVPAQTMRDSGNNNPGTMEYNFGNAPYAISSGNSDGNGHGNFEYAVPSGYFALNTKNLAEHG